MTSPSDADSLATTLPNGKRIPHDEYWLSMGLVLDEANLPSCSLNGQELVEHLLGQMPDELTSHEAAICYNWCDERAKPIGLLHAKYPDKVPSINVSKHLGGSGFKGGNDQAQSDRARAMGWRDENDKPKRFGTRAITRAPKG